MEQQYLINAKNQKTAIILPITKYKKMMEDIHDLSIIAERKDEPTLSLEEIKKRLKKDELL